MALLKKLKSLLGLGEGRSSGERRDEDVGVTVEHDRDEGRESAPESASTAGSESGDPPIETGTDAGSVGQEPADTEAEEPIDEESATDPEEAPPGTDAPGTETAEPAPAETDESTEEGSNVDGTVDVEPGVDAPEPDEAGAEAESDPSPQPGTRVGPASESEPEPEPEVGSEPDEGGTEAEAGTVDADESLQDVKGIGPSYADRLSEAGVETVDQLADADADELADDTGLSTKRIEGWIERAKHR